MMAMAYTLGDFLPRLEHNDKARGFLKWIHANAVASRKNVNPLTLLEGHRAEWVHKASIAVMQTGDVSALANGPEARAFVQVLDGRTVRGQLPGLIQAPPYITVPFPTNDPRPVWVGEYQPIPMADIEFGAPRTGVAKFAVIVGLTNEVERLDDGRALNVIERVIMRAVRRADDSLFLGDAAAVESVNPEGLLFGVTAVGNGSPAVLDDDLSALWTSVSDGDPAFPAFVASARGAMYLASLSSENGSAMFPNISLISGGDIFGVPLIISRAAGNRLILIDGGAIAVVDEGIAVDPAREAAVQMNDSPTPGAVALVSAWQNNSLFVRVQRYVSWTKLATDAVAYVELPIDGSPA